MGRIKKIVVILGGKKLSGSKTQNISENYLRPIGQVG